MSYELIFALLCAVAAIAYGFVSVKWILKQPEGNERMREIAAAIQEGANAYLNRHRLPFYVNDYVRKQLEQNIS